MKELVSTMTTNENQLTSDSSQSKKNNLTKSSFKKINESLQTIHQELSKTSLYKDWWTPVENMKQLLYSINKIYTFLYNRKASNLTVQDAQIFIDTSIQKLTSLQRIIHSLH